VSNLHRPLVGFVIATLNADKQLQNCLDSIYRQDDPSWEIVVIDGGSVDSTIDIIHRNASRLKYWLSEPDQGIYDAWNKAIPFTSAAWIHFLGADDYVFSSTVVSSMRPILNGKAAGHRIVYGRVALVNRTGELIEILGKPWSEVERGFKREMCIPHQGVLHRRDLFAGEHQFDASFRFAGDYEFLLRELKHSVPYFCQDTCIAGWRVGGVTSRPDYNLSVLREFRIARQRHHLTNCWVSWTEAKGVCKVLLNWCFGTRILNSATNMYRRLTGRLPLYDTQTDAGNPMQAQEGKDRRDLE
jgi:glycosyltransferase involved in cell wall biosynthesis